MTTLNASEEFLEAAAASDAADFWACAAISFLVVSSVVGIIGNTMVCIAIATDRRLQNKTNYALFSLAIADLCVCIFVMPLSMITDSYGAWVVSYELCFAYVYLDVFLCSASIVHMSGIALDRYIALSRPFMKSVKSKKKVAFQLVVVWLTTIFISSPLSIMALLDPSNIYIEESRSCGIMNRGFMLYGSLLSFVIPLIIMSVTNVKTMRILNDKASLSQNSADQFGNGLRRSRPPTRKNGYTRSMSCKGKKPSNFSYTSLSTQNGISRKATCVSAISSDHIELLPHTFVKNSSFDEKDFLKKSPTFRTKVDRFLDRTSSMFTILSSKVSRRSSVHSTSERIANEQKATRVLVVMCVAFSLCWCPFFVANIIYAVCGSSCALPEMAGRLVLWLGYISSTLNPIIYPIFNRRWRVAFKRILLCQCFGPYRADPNHHNYSRNQTFVPAETHTWSNFDRSQANGCGGLSTTTTHVLSVKNGDTLLAKPNEEMSQNFDESFRNPARPKLQRNSTRTSYRSSSESSGANSVEVVRRTSSKNFKNGRVSLTEAQKPSVASDKPLLVTSDEDDVESFHSAAEESLLITMSPEIRKEPPNFPSTTPAKNPQEPQISFPESPICLDSTPIRSCPSTLHIPKSKSSDDYPRILAEKPLPPSTKDDLALDVRPEALCYVLQKETFL